MQKGPVEVKEAVKAKVNDVKSVAAEKEAAAKEAVTKTVETTAKKAEDTVKKAESTVKKAVKKTNTKKAAAKKEMVPEIVIQFNGNEGGVKNVVDKITAAYVAEGHRASSIKSMQVYLKPEEYAAYYVVNEKFAGRVDLF